MRSAVFTIKKRTYQVCLNCGKEFEYSWALTHDVQSSVAHSPDVPMHGIRPTERPAI
jgi:hypothetical protein